MRSRVSLKSVITAVDHICSHKRTHSLLSQFHGSTHDCAMSYGLDGHHIARYHCHHPQWSFRIHETSDGKQGSSLEAPSTTRQSVSSNTHSTWLTAGHLQLRIRSDGVLSSNHPTLQSYCRTPPC